MYVMKKSLIPFLFLSLIVMGCLSETNKTKKKETIIEPSIKKEVQKEITLSTKQMLSKAEVPILCYHNIREIRPNASELIKTYTVTPAAFKEQMKALYDNGFHTILPDQLYEYLEHNKPLPAKPIMITFDDTREEQYSLAAVDMKKYNFKGVFFIMTVSINRSGYLTKTQIKELSDEGNTIGAHTWDHHMVTKYVEKDWNIQLIKPKKLLETITNKPVKYFAYPFGLWNNTAIAQVKNCEYKLAFILSSKRDTIEPKYTIRRMIVAGTWKTSKMLKAIDATFN